MTRSILGALLALCILLCACAAQPPAGTPADAQPMAQHPESKQRVYLLDSVDHVEMTSRMVQVYNDTSADTLVTANYLNNDSYDESLRVMLRAGSKTIDCVYIRQPGQVNQYAANGWLTDLTDYVSLSGLDVANYGSTLEIVSADERIHALPLSKGAWLLFYNKTIFDRYQIDYPGQLTWDEYADLAQRISTGAGYRKVWGGYIPAWTMNLGASPAGEYLTDDELPLTTRYVELLNRLYNIDGSHPGIAMMEGTASRPYEWFVNGQSAMLINGDWTINLLRSTMAASGTRLDWDIAPLPVFDGVDGPATVAGSSYMAVPAASTQPQRAFDFLRFACGEEGAKISAEHTTCPAYFTEESASMYLQRAQVPGARYFFESLTYNEENSHPAYRDINNLFKVQVTGYLRGRYSLEDAFTSFYEGRRLLLP